MLSIEVPNLLALSAISINDNMGDFMSTVAYLENWIREQSDFDFDFRPGRYQMTQVITSPKTTKALGYGQLEIYIPIKIIE